MHGKQLVLELLVGSLEFRTRSAAVEAGRFLAERRPLEKELHQLPGYPVEPQEA
ncbi:hypothetical protein [Streptomyces oceani]|uniref:hypothetical protein n=1 Tax=Streptomyces oceani TaxID=1075402 RepID=UPI00147D96DF|nr:hypothetical protein [Streptomyces oceani]